MNFPAGMPDGCPLPAATPCDGDFFLVSKTNPVQAADCLSQAERGRALNATGDKACMRHGVSVFPTFESCEHHREVFPALGDHVAVAKLHASHGVQADTPSRTAPAHKTWWPYAQLARHPLFSVVAASG